MIDEGDLPLERNRPTVKIYAIKNEEKEYEEVNKGELEIISDCQDDKSIHFMEVYDQEGVVILRSQVKSENKFQKQKKTVIVWTDPQQMTFEDLAISFEKQEECDLYWKIICEKMGKNYLNIVNEELLEAPTLQTLLPLHGFALQKPDVLVYQILKSAKWMGSMLSLFQQCEKDNNDMGKCLIKAIILDCIMGVVDHKLMQALLADPSFQLLLLLERYKSSYLSPTVIDYPSIYKDKVKIKKILCFKPQVVQKIQIVHRAIFYKQNVLKFSPKTASIENILTIIINEGYNQIQQYIIKENVLEEIIALKPEQTKANVSQKEANAALNAQKLVFLLEIFVIYFKNHNQKAKNRLVQKIYASGLIPFLKQLLVEGYERVIDVFNCISCCHPFKFIDYLRDEKDDKGSNDLQRKIAILYSNGSKFIKQSIIALVKTFEPVFAQKIDYLHFFIGSFLHLVLSLSKDEGATLNLIAILLEGVQQTQTILTKVLDTKALQKIVTQIKERMQPNKINELLMIKVLALIFIHLDLNASLKSSLQKSFDKNLIDQTIKSGYLDYCMSILEKNIDKNNLLSSSMLQNLSILQKMNFNKIHEYLINNYQIRDRITKYLQKIFHKMPLKCQSQETQYKENNQIAHEAHLENELMENYFMREDDTEQINFANLPSATAIDDKLLIKYDLQNLDKITEEISMKKQEKQEIIPNKHPRKLRKLNEQDLTTPSFSFNVEFDQKEGID